MNFQLSAATDFLSEQEWFQNLKAKWDELDPQSRGYLKIAGMGTSVLIFVYLVLATMWSVHSLKQEVSDKSDLLAVIQNANDELRRLRDNQPPAGAADIAGPWSSYFETEASTAGIDKTALATSASKPGNSSDVAKEELFDIGIKHVTIKQVVKYAFSLESGSRPVKLRNLLIETEADPEGYMNATLSVSGFTLVTADKK